MGEEGPDEVSADLSDSAILTFSALPDHTNGSVIHVSVAKASFPIQIDTETYGLARMYLN